MSEIFDSTDRSTWVSESVQLPASLSIMGGTNPSHRAFDLSITSADDRGVLVQTDFNGQQVSAVAHDEEAAIEKLRDSLLKVLQ